jgi:6-phosphofructokinase 1
MFESTSTKKIGVLTSGGDAPGMNTCVRAIVRTAITKGLKIYGISGGYDGLMHGNYSEMGLRDVGGILQRGGTILQTKRSMEFKTPEGQREAIRMMNNAGIDGLIVIGGDGSLTGAHKLAEQGVQVVGIPGSIDNDIWGTDMCIGVDTALNTIMDATDKIRDTASSHNRAFLIETMGRNCGYLAVMAGLACGAEMVLIPEVSVPVEDVVKTIADAYLRGKTHAIIIVAEGYATNINDLASAIEKVDVGFESRVTILGHIQRGGKPSAYDRILSTRFGVKAVEYFMEDKTDVMTGLQGGGIVPVAIADIISKHQIINPEYYEVARMLAR